MFPKLLFLAETLSATFILWLGLYVITRDLPWRHETLRLWQRPALLTGTGLALLALYLYGIALESVAVRPEEYLLWQRLTWWGIPIAVVLFARAAEILTRAGRSHPWWSRITYPAALISAVLLAIGLASGMVLDRSAITPRTSRFQPYTTPLYPLFNLVYYGFILGSLLITVWILLRYYAATPRGSAERRRIRPLAIGSLLFLLGALTTTVLAWLGLSYAPKQIGDYIVTAGAAVISFGIARYNALQHEKVLIYDFRHSLVSVSATVGVYLVAYGAVCLLFGYPQQPQALALLAFLAVLTQTPLSWGDTILDRLLMPRWAAGYRNRLVLMRQEPLTTPNPQHFLDTAEEEFGALLRSVRMDELERLISHEIDRIFQYAHFDDPKVLAASRLLELHIGRQALACYAEPRGASPDALTGQQRATVLRELLAHTIDESLCPPDAEPASSARIEQVILRKKYVDGWSRTEVERYLFEQHQVAVTGGAYSRHLERARARLAQLLFDREVNHNSPTS